VGTGVLWHRKTPFCTTRGLEGRVIAKSFSRPDR
jgi:hypothetical protein